MSDLIKIKEKLISRLKEISCLPIANDETTETVITINFDSSAPLSVTIDKDEMVVLYANEHNNFLRSPCKSDDEWIDSLCNFISKLSNHKIVFSYVHAKSVLLSYKVIAKHSDGTNEVLTRVTASPNILLRLFPKEKTFQEITFKSS
jgi:hypothetical protein